MVLDAEARRISLNDVVKRAFAAYLSPADAAVVAAHFEPFHKGGKGARTRKRTTKGSGEPVSGKPHE